MSCSGEVEKCSKLERQKQSAEGQLEVLTRRLNGILELLYADAISSSIEDAINKVHYLLQYCFISTEMMSSARCLFDVAVDKNIMYVCG